MKCPQCSSDIGDDSKFCKECGSNITSVEESQPQFTKTLESPAFVLDQGKVLADRYEILEKIGEGGMGEVWLAVDKNLDRQVAIKILPAAFSEDPERLARFEREAKLLAALNHTNIAAIHGLEESDAQRFLVLELAEGETLKKKLDKGPLEVDEALDLCRQITGGLEAAHEKGIIHRDLKPGNIMVSPNGQIKILDFGLAKAFAEETTDTGIDIEKSPTITAQMTKPGVVLGTAAYMSPEQARGRAVDKRTDIWAFGCVLYECITGIRAFGGETVSDSLAHILKSEPDWTKLPSNTPTTTRTLLRHCLQKDPRRRLHDIADARIEIEEAESSSIRSGIDPDSRTTAGPGTSLIRRSWWNLVPWILFGLTVAFLVLLVVSQNTVRRGAQDVLRFHVEVPLALFPEPGQGVVLSPGGDKLVYIANIGQSLQQYLPTAGQTEIHVRHLDQLAVNPLSGTMSAYNSLAFSPDGQWLCFATENELKKISIAGGTAETLCEVPEIMGADWGANNSIVFGALSLGGLMRISAAGGKIQEMTALEEGEYDHLWPQFLPGGQRVLFNAGMSADFREATIEVLSLQTGERKVVHRGGYYPRYLSTGHLVFTHESTLYAAPFDLDNLELSNTPTPVLEGVRSSPRHGEMNFTFSHDGTIAYLLERPPVKRAIVWVDRQGNEEPFAAEPGVYLHPRISPDGTHALITSEVSENLDVWVLDLGRQTSSRLTFDPAGDYRPRWTPDGQRVVFSSQRNESAENLYWKSADGTGEVEGLTTSPNDQVPHFWSLDGKTLVFEEQRPETVQDLYVLSMEGERSSRPLIQTEFTEDRPSLSPNGRWMAYRSNESGRFEIYVRPFPNVERGKWKISTDGGISPVWGPNGRELFYRDLDDGVMMLVGVETEPTFTHATPEILFTGNYFRAWGRNYDISPDGQRFLMLKEVGQTSETEIRLVLVQNWFEELKRLVPTGR